VILKKSSNGQMVTLSKEGYEKKSFQPTTAFNPVCIANLVFLFPWIIDCCTGATFKYEPTSYTIQLNKVGK